MKNLLLLLTFIPFLAFSQENNDCEERTMPYWANNINSRIKGENPTLRKAFKEIQLTETNIQPSNGFITLRLYINKTGEFCEMETFQIDENYQPTVFNNGELITALETIALSLTNWQRDEDYKTYNLIRLKIKNGKIEEIF
ncbi:hypothetical protein PXD56_01465 [Maribacter sp. SA7]|uniref:hypothetical protein n=1 Tax=Maribacter zhoushanensis TaxID=3030012 RepID=UPI0023EC24E3|nr:hypothetical protein [Maribacter zhoushanensis]MDF4201603.1 hypothetical protein [Maribacter zhoushanensis]